MTPRDRYLRRTYGITEAQYDEMLEAQHGVCALCFRPPKSRRLHVDHDHKPPYRVRGLLCFRCNRALPDYLDAEWLRRAADYLERSHG